MSTGGVGGSSYNVTDINITKTNQAQGTEATKRSQTLKDTIQIGTLKFEFVYKQDPNTPVLPQPQENPSEQNNNNNTQAKANPKFTYLQNLDGAIEKYTDSDKQADQVLMAILTGNVPEDENFANILNDVQTDVAEEMANEFDEWKPPNLKKEFKKDIGESRSNRFEKKLEGANLKALAKKLGISEKEAKSRLLTGYYIGSDDPEIQSEVNKLTQEVDNEIRTEFGLSQNFEIPSADKTNFQAKVTAQLDDQAETLINDYAKKNNLSEQETKQLRYAYYNQDKTNLPFAKEAGEIFAQAKTAILSQFGISGDMSINPSNATFNSELNGEYSIIFNDLVSNLSQNDQALVFLALNDPTNPKVTPQVMKLVDSLKAKALNQVQVNNALPADWNPTIKLQPVGLNVQMAMNSLKYLEESLDDAFKIVANLPEGPAKSSAKEIMKSIMDAITMLKQLIYKIQAQDAKFSKDLGKMQEKTSLEKMELEKKKADEAKKKQEELKKKAEKQKLLMKILGPILVVVGVLIGIVTGGAGFFMVAAIVVGMFLVADSIYQSASEKPSLLAQMVDELVKEGDGGIAAAWILIALISIISFNPSIGAMVAANSGILGKTIKAKGGSDKAARDWDIVFSVALAVGGGVGQALGKGARLGATVGKGAIRQAEAKAMKATTEALKKAGTKGAAKALKNMKSAIKSANKVISKTAKIKAAAAKGGAKGMRNSLKLLQAKISRWLTNTERVTKNFKIKKGLVPGFDKISASIKIGESGIKFAAAYNQMQIHQLKADLLREQGDKEAMIQELQAMIKILRQMINRILGGLSKHGEDLKELTEQGVDMFKKQSSIMDQISQANRG